MIEVHRQEYVMEKTTITFYQLNHSHYNGEWYISKRSIKLGKDVTIKKVGDEMVIVTVKDSWQNGHNGDWEDENYSGYLTFEGARRWLIEKENTRYIERIAKIKTLKEDLECIK
jgi:hypothetical protein